MIDRDYVARMARYNAWQNENVTAAAQGLDEDALTQDRGAFFGSIFATMNHLLWADTMWMSRFCTDVEAPTGGIAGSPSFTPDLSHWTDARSGMDARLLDWGETLEEATLREDLSWYSGALGRDMVKPLALCVVHLFNHQTHHRGQIHAMLTAAGARPGDTDLFAMPEIL